MFVAFLSGKGQPVSALAAVSGASTSVNCKHAGVKGKTPEIRILKSLSQALEPLLR